MPTSPSERGYSVRHGANRFCTFLKEHTKGRQATAKQPGAPNAMPLAQGATAHALSEKPLPPIPFGEKPLPELPTKPYHPISVSPKQFSGPQKQSEVVGTEVCRQAAEMLIDRNGRFDRTHIDSLIADLKKQEALPPHQQAIGAHHRQHMIKTLQAMKSNDELAETIDSTCAHKPPAGNAAQLVGAAVNLPAGQQPVAADARKAIVMALLGNLRQDGKVGSCYATSTAIALHSESPACVAKQMKQLVEDNRLTMTESLTKTWKQDIDVPLNKRTANSEAQTRMRMRFDGAYLGKAGSPPEKAQWLHDSPGMAHALDALGIPPGQRQHYVSAAVKQIARQRTNIASQTLKSGLQKLTGNKGLVKVSPEEIISQLAQTTPGKLPPDQRRAAAMDAFACSKAPGMLRAWEYTLASRAQMALTGELTNVADTALCGADISGRPDLRSPKQANIALQNELKTKPKFSNVNLDSIDSTLMASASDAMRQRLAFMFDPDVKGGQVSADGVSSVGGRVLHERDTVNGKTEWRPIDTPEKFQAAMGRVAEDAETKTAGLLQYISKNTPADKEALQLLSNNLRESIKAPNFCDQAATRFSIKCGEGAVNNPGNTPWRQASGGAEAKQLVGAFGSQAEHHETLAPPADGGKPDAKGLIGFLARSQSAIASELNAKASAMNGEEFGASLVNSSHGMVLRPMEMKDIWQNGMSADQWVQQNLTAPAEKYAKSNRSEPPLHDLVAKIGKQIGMSEQQINAAHREVINNSGGFRHGHQVYNLQAVHDTFAKRCATMQNPETARQSMQWALTQAAPFPPEMTKRVADVNWQDSKGNPKYLGFRHNPFENRLESTISNKEGTETQHVGDNWLSGYYRLHAPLNP